MALAIRWRPWPCGHPVASGTFHWTDKNKPVCKVCNWSRVVDCLMTVSWLSHDCIMTVGWLYYNCLMTVSWRKLNYFGFGGPWVSAVLALVLQHSWSCPQTDMEFVTDIICVKFLITGVKCSYELTLFLVNSLSGALLYCFGNFFRCIRRKLV